MKFRKVEAGLKSQFQLLRHGVSPFPSQEARVNTTKMPTGCTNVRKNPGESRIKREILRHCSGTERPNTEPKFGFIRTEEPIRVTYYARESAPAKSFLSSRLSKFLRTFRRNHKYESVLRRLDFTYSSKVYSFKSSIKF